jgi:site-specific DNA-cytosine methylase
LDARSRQGVDHAASKPLVHDTKVQELHDTRRSCAGSPTVAYGNREVHVHPDSRRRLSVYEAMLLQGFPPTYELLGSLSDQVTQVSEAVPPPLGRAIADSVKRALRRYAAEAAKTG